MLKTRKTCVIYGDVVKKLAQALEEFATKLKEQEQARGRAQRQT